MRILIVEDNLLVQKLLKSGGPVMTVKEYTREGSEIHCVCFGEKKELKNVYVKENMIEKYEV